MFGLASADLWSIVLTAAAGLIGYWLRTRQGSGLPSNLEGVIKNLFVQQEHSQACGILCQLAKHAEPQAAATPTATVPPELTALLTQLLTQQRATNEAINKALLANQERISPPPQ